MEWAEPGPGTGLVWLRLRCERCGERHRRLADAAPPRGTRLSDVDWAGIRASEWSPRPSRLLIGAVIAVQLAVLGLMLALALTHLPH